MDCLFVCAIRVIIAGDVVVHRWSHVQGKTPDTPGKVYAGIGGAVKGMGLSGTVGFVVPVSVGSIIVALVQVRAAVDIARCEAHEEFRPVHQGEKEYRRDLAAGKPIAPPENYYPGDDPSAAPQVTWRAHANLLFCNWLNYFVYQTTPYELSMIPQERETP